MRGAMTEKKSGHLMPVPDTGQSLTESASDSLSDESSGWTPTAKQALLLAEAGKGGLGRSVTSVCEAANVSRDSFYRWMKEDGFRRAWNELARQIVEVGMPGVTNAVVQKAVGGNMQAAKLAMQAGGMVGSGVNVHLGDKIDKQLNRLGFQSLAPCD